VPQVQVILNSIIGGTTHDTETYPVILRFGEDKTYDEAEWVIPSYPRTIPAPMLSELRITEGPVQVVIEGPEGFQSGPHPSTWVRSNYPRGKDVSILEVDPTLHKMTGVSVTVVEGTLVVDEFALNPGGGASRSPSS
jgi:hypothetical protein